MFSYKLQIGLTQAYGQRPLEDQVQNVCLCHGSEIKRLQLTDDNSLT